MTITITLTVAERDELLINLTRARLHTPNLPAAAWQRNEDLSNLLLDAGASFTIADPPAAIPDPREPGDFADDAGAADPSLTGGFCA